MSDTNNEGVVFLKSYYEAAKKLPLKQRQAFYDAVLTYGFEGVSLELSDMAEMLFIAVKPVINSSKKRYTAAKINGGKGGAPKGNNNASKQPKINPSVDLENKQSVEPENNLDKDKEKEKEKENIPPISPTGDSTEKQSDRFEQFWKAYPRKTGKGAARKSFEKRKPSQALLDKMLTAIEAATHSDDWRKDGGQFIPHPATWLNQERWEDELPARGGYANGQTLIPTETTDMPGFKSFLDGDEF